MRALAVVQFILGLAMISAAQRSKIPTIPRSLPPQMKHQLDIETGGLWKATKVDPLLLASRADSWTAHLISARAVTHYLYEGPRGFGKAEGDVSIKSPSTYRFDAGWVEESVHQTKLGHRTYVANGQKLQWYDVRGYSPVVLVSHSRMPKSVLSSWPLEMQNLVFAGLGNTDKPITSFVLAAKNAGMKLETARRTITIDQHTFTTNRIVISSSKGPKPAMELRS